MNSAAESRPRFADVIEANGVTADDARRACAVDGQMPQCVLFPPTLDALCQCVAASDGDGLAMIPFGNATQLAVGRAPRRYDVALSTRRLHRVLAHEAADMTVTVEGGVTLAELNAVLAPAGQRLPLDPPHPESTTIGALIATDVSGPLRLSQGKVRDLLIGVTAVLADGTLVHGGGRVVKNVAGYDLMKLFTGSFGTLGIVVEATFKLRPLPEFETVIVLPAESGAEAVVLAAEVLAAPVAPLYVEALNLGTAGGAGATIGGPVVVVGCGGTAEEVAVQRQRLAARFSGCGVNTYDADEGSRIYAALRDFPSRGKPSDSWGCKLSVPASSIGAVLARLENEVARYGAEAAWLAHVGSGVAHVRCAAAEPGDWLVTFAEWLQTTVRAASGWATFDILPAWLKDRIDPWGAEPPGAQLMRGIKQALDPHDRFSPGRFVGGI